VGLFKKKDKFIGREELQECVQESVKKCMGECAGEMLREGERKLLEAVENRLQATEAMVENLNKQAKRQSEAVEDLLDELQEKETAAMEYRNSLREKQEREEALLDLIGEWQQQMGMLEERICGEAMEDTARQEAWKKQLGLLKEQLAVKEKLCSIEETGTEGEHVDYRIHEVIRALDAEGEGTAGTVAKVHSRGMVYEGRVIAKAKVEAYKL
jgi:Molecular chaperone GrpE (heat shock protein)